MSDPMPADRCGRPTQRGKACGRVRARLAPYTLHHDEFGPACRTHLTPAEWEQVERRGRELAREDRQRVDALRAHDPACWSWPIPPLPPPEQRLVDDVERHGLASPRQREQFWRFHDGHCAICGADDARLVEDHDHVTGRVRGRICSHCNTAEPHDHRPDSVFQRYRERSPAVILGYVSQYVHPTSGRLDWGEPDWLAMYDVPGDDDTER